MINFYLSITVNITQKSYIKMIISINITTSPFINVYVKFQENKIFDWLAIPIYEKMNIQQFFEQFI